MTRSAIVLDRIVTLLAGVGLIALGAVMLLWSTHLTDGLPAALSLPWLTAATVAGWWPWVQAAVGLVLIALAVRWLLTHSPPAKVDSLHLDDMQSSSSVTANVAAVADAAAAILEESPMVRSSRGKAIIDRGIRTVVLTVTVQTPADAAAVIHLVDEACAHVAGMIGDSTIATRAVIDVARASRRNRRVR